jgi:hypothetical protein
LIGVAASALVPWWAGRASLAGSTMPEVSPPRPPLQLPRSRHGSYSSSYRPRAATLLCHFLPPAAAAKMGKEKAYELRDKKKNELLKKVEELKTELAQVRGRQR